jgi:choline dehydrogenase
MEEFDYIVVGAGSAGCVIAARLTEDPAVRVLLLEAGGSDRTALCTTPGMVSIIHTVPQVKKKFDWGFYCAPREETFGRKMPYVRGKVMGGSSAINGMVWVRGHRQNYDDWAAEGCEGWGYDDVLPYFKKLESWEGGADEFRGDSGPVQVTEAGDQSPVSAPFRDSVAQTCGVSQSNDYNGATQEGIGVCQVSAKDGRRYSTSEAYIEPNRKRPNLIIRSGAMVHRVVIEGGRATGVEYSTKKGTVTVRASREVVLSGGVIGSAQILMLSGIGPADQLKALDIDVVADLPVGENLHDHLFFPLTYLAPNGGHRGTPFHFFGGMLKEMMTGGTWFGRTVFESMGFVKTDPSLAIPDCQIHMLPWAYPSPNQDAPVRPTVDMRPSITVWPTLIYPKSRGEMRLLSKDPTAAPFIDPHFLEAQEDVEFMIKGIALLREIMATGPIAKEVTEELHPGPKFFSDADLRREMPNRVQTVYHPVGTCRMGVDERAVVDPQLRVRGIEGLRVADAAIMPYVIGGNTNAACIMIGEKAADLLRVAQ